MDTLLSLSVALLAGLLLSRLTKKIGLPDVTAYLIAGILVGPYCLGALGLEGIGFTSFEKVQGLSSSRTWRSASSLLRWAMSSA